MSIMKHKILAVATACMLMFTSAVPAMAAEAVPQPEATKGSLKVSFVLKDTEEGTNTAISGATFEITKVADLNWHGGSPEYVLSDGFKDTGVDFNGMTAAESEKAAATFAGMNIASLASATTDRNGSATFAGLDHGIYLVEETAVTGEATDYSTVEPYLVLVPGITDGEWQYKVVSNPKTEPVHKPVPEVPEVPGKPEKPAGSVKTGDDTDVRIYLGLFLCAATGIIILATAKKKHGKEDNRNA